MTDFADCGSCGRPQQGRCENNLVSLLGDVFAFILNYFRSEEEVIRNSMLRVIDRAVCEAHIKDHAEIAAKVRRSLWRVARWVTNHIAGMLLLCWTVRYESQHRPIDR